MPLMPVMSTFYLMQLTLAKYEGELTSKNHPEGSAQSIIKDQSPN
jgi:hypothetical protein